MSRKKVSRREVIKKTSAGVGALATASVLGGKAAAEGGSIQVTITLDSGAFLTDEEANGFAYSEVGYFLPDIRIYGDGGEIARIEPNEIGTSGRLLKVRHTDANGNTVGTGIRLSDDLVRHLLRLHVLYDGVIQSVDRSKYHCLFHFNSGSFRASKVKERYFKEYDVVTHQLTGNRKSAGFIAHDIIVQYTLNAGEKLTLSDDAGTVIWSSDSALTNERIGVEVMADNSTAVMFYRDALKLRGQNCWLPNQDDPPPTWTHGGPGGGGG